MGTKRSAADEHDPDDSTAAVPAGFDTVRRGYRPEQVDTAVRELRWRLEMAERAQHEAEERAASLTVSLEAARATTPDTFGMRAEKVLRMAEHDAAQRRERAVHDADRIIDAAHDEAERLTAAAHDEAERLTAAARDEAERARTDALASVAQVHADAAAARRETDLCADTAAAMHEHVVGLRGAVRGELARLHAAMGAELRVLDEMVVAPPATTPAPAPAAAAAAQVAVPVAPVVALPEQRAQPSRDAAGDAVPDIRTEPAGA